MKFYLFLFLNFFTFFSSLHSQQTEISKEEKNQIKSQIPLTTGIPYAYYKVISEGSTFPKLKGMVFGQTLSTLHICGVDIGLKIISPSGTYPKPSEFGQAIAPNFKDPSKAITLLQEDYITEITYHREGEAIKGKIAYKYEGLYEGKLEYKAIKEYSQWKIVEYYIPQCHSYIRLEKASENRDPDTGETIWFPLLSKDKFWYLNIVSHLFLRAVANFYPERPWHSFISQKIIGNNVNLDPETSALYWVPFSSNKEVWILNETRVLFSDLNSFSLIFLRSLPSKKGGRASIKLNDLKSLIQNAKQDQIKFSFLCNPFKSNFKIEELPEFFKIFVDTKFDFLKHTDSDYQYWESFLIRELYRDFAGKEPKDKKERIQIAFEKKDPSTFLVKIENKTLVLNVIYKNEQFKYLENYREIIEITKHCEETYNKSSTVFVLTGSKTLSIPFLWKIYKNFTDEEFSIETNFF